MKNRSYIVTLAACAVAALGTSAAQAHLLVGNSSYGQAKASQNTLNAMLKAGTRYHATANATEKTAMKPQYAATSPCAARCSGDATNVASKKPTSASERIRNASPARRNLPRRNTAPSISAIAAAPTAVVIGPTKRSRSRASSFACTRNARRAPRTAPDRSTANVWPVMGTGVHAVMGTGGAPEGVITAAAMRCLNGEILARLVIDRPELEERVAKMGIKDMKKIYHAEDLAPGENIVFAATGVTDGSLLKGVRFFGEGTRTSSIVMTRKSGKVRFVESIHLVKRPDVKVRFQ